MPHSLRFDRGALISDLTGHGLDEALQAARAGADPAWATIYRELSPSVLGYLRARGAAEPEDMLGEVFLQVARNFDRFVGGAAEFQGWVFTIAHRRLVDESRRRATRAQITPADAADLARWGPLGDTEDEAVRNLSEQRIREALRSLAPDQQAVLLLRIFGGLSISEVANAVGKRPGAVKALQRRGIDSLRRRMGGVPL